MLNNVINQFFLSNRPRPLGAGEVSQCLSDSDITNPYALSMAEVNQVKSVCVSIAHCTCLSRNLVRADLAKISSGTSHQTVMTVSGKFGVKTTREAKVNPADFNSGSFGISTATQIGNQITGANKQIGAGQVGQKAAGH